MHPTMMRRDRKNVTETFNILSLFNDLWFVFGNTVLDRFGKVRVLDLALKCI
jgi:hypothetical protein